ncbi:MAG: hypothetical protein AAF942_02500 [Pseudomonadota bacterium]
MLCLKRVILSAAAIVLVSSAAVAHPAGTREIGMSHVLLSVGHVTTFLALGIAAGVIVMSRSAYSVWIANFALAAFLIFEAAMHVQSDGLLFGIEVAVAGAALALGAWRATTFVAGRKTSPIEKKSR